MNYAKQASKVIPAIAALLVMAEQGLFRLQGTTKQVRKERVMRRRRMRRRMMGKE